MQQELHPRAHSFYASMPSNQIQNLGTLVAAKDAFDRLQSQLTNYISNKLDLGINPEQELLDQWGMTVKINTGNDVKLYFIEQQIWINRIHNTIVNFQKLLPELQVLPSAAAGAQLLRYFIIDMLGGDTPEATIFAYKSGSFFNDTHIVEPWMQTVSLVSIAIWNILCYLLCVLYGAAKGPEWQLHWISLCIVTLAFLMLIDFTFEAAIMGFVIPSQILSAVRSVQIQLSLTVFNHILPPKTSILKDNKLPKFSASNHLYISYLLAEEFKYLPEAKFILSYIDPLPHVEFKSLIDVFKIKTLGNHKINPLNNDLNKRFQFRSNVSLNSFAAFLIVIGTCHPLFQRIIVSIPLPIITSIISVLVGCIFNQRLYIWIPLSLICGCVFIYYSIHFKTYITNLYGHITELLKQDTSINESIMKNCRLAS